MYSSDMQVLSFSYIFASGDILIVSISQYIQCTTDNTTEPVSVSLCIAVH